jgi:hypothetical protein
MEGIARGAMKGIGIFLEEMTKNMKKSVTTAQNVRNTLQECSPLDRDIR